VGSALPDLRFRLDGTSNLAKWPPGLRGSKESTFFGGKKWQKSAVFCFFGKTKYMKNTFCKKIGSKTSFQLSAMGKAIYTPLYEVATAN